MIPRRYCVGLCITLQFLIGYSSLGGLLRPGKLSGVVVFDRWGGCMLYSGVFVMYVSEATKKDLREYQNKPIEIDAKELWQPVNPGDGRIGKFEVLGPASTKRSRVKLDGLRIQALMKSKPGSKPILSIRMTNFGMTPLELFSSELAPTLLAKKSPQVKSHSPSDGPSYAVLTRESFEIGSRDPRWQGRGSAYGKGYTWTIGRNSAMPHSFTLQPGQTRDVNIFFDLPEGEYDFLSGYGGGAHESKCLSSNLLAFDVNQDGTATRVEVEGR